MLLTFSHPLEAAMFVCLCVCLFTCEVSVTPAGLARHPRVSCLFLAVVFDFMFVSVIIMFVVKKEKIIDRILFFFIFLIFFYLC